MVTKDLDCHGTIYKTAKQNCLIPTITCVENKKVKL